ncbi:MAG: pyridoxamine 5'-phosphate oxidase family protein [Chloroflexales bacterium]
MQQADRETLRALVGGHRQAALGSLADGSPFLSMVLYAVERRDAAAPAFLIHISRLAPHTRQLLADPRASLMVMQPDVDTDDPQALPRATFQATARVIHVDGPDFAGARACYLARLPQQAYLFSFPDFLLVRLTPSAARFVGGFASAVSLDAAQVAEALGEG